MLYATGKPPLAGWIYNVNGLQVSLYKLYDEIVTQGGVSEATPPQVWTRLSQKVTGAMITGDELKRVWLERIDQFPEFMDRRVQEYNQQQQQKHLQQLQQQHQQQQNQQRSVWSSGQAHQTAPSTGAVAAAPVVPAATPAHQPASATHTALPTVQALLSGVAGRAADASHWASTAAGTACTCPPACAGADMRLCCCATAQSCAAMAFLVVVRFHLCITPLLICFC